MDVSYGGSFLAGLLSFLSPCVLPLVPPYLCFLAGTTFQALENQGDDTDRAALARVRWTALAFVLGFSTVFVSMGATASVGGVVGPAFPALTSEPGHEPCRRLSSGRLALRPRGRRSSPLARRYSRRNSYLLSTGKKLLEVTCWLLVH